MALPERWERWIPDRRFAPSGMTEGEDALDCLVASAPRNDERKGRHCAPQHDRIHHPANGQWRFGRLLCKGAGRNKKTGKRCEPRALPFKGEREEPCID